MLALATALELVVVVAVLRPLASQRAHEQAELALDRATRQISALYDPYDLAALAHVLRQNQLPDREAFLLLRAWDGRLVAARPADSLRAASAAAGGEPALELLGHRTVTIEGSRFGDVEALGPPIRASWWSLPEARTVALSLPFAVLASGAAGLLMVRILARRLRALEQMATRVTEGELTARIETSDDDEIGRLEARMNLMTERLAMARDELARNDLQRRQLFADITHELATPLTSIRGYVETLLDAKVQLPEVKRTAFLHDVLEESRRLDALVSDLLELTRLEAGAAPLQLTRLDWAALCRHAARRLAPRFAAARLALECAGTESGAWVHADGRRLEQVVDNLLGNALRYVPAGGSVQLTIVPLQQGDGTTRWRMLVSDDGPGIATADLPHVFERFYRAEAVRAHGGTGLGLAIVREIALQHGGSASARARDPKGVTFVVELPGVG